MEALTAVGFSHWHIPLHIFLSKVKIAKFLLDSQHFKTEVANAVSEDIYPFPIILRILLSDRRMVPNDTTPQTTPLRKLRKQRPGLNS